jgi:hypothetical protein
MKACSCTQTNASFQYSFKELRDYVEAAEKNFFRKFDLQVNSPGVETLLLFDGASGQIGVAVSRDQWQTGHFYVEMGARVLAYTVAGKFDEKNVLRLDFHFVQPQTGHAQLLVEQGRLGSISCTPGASSTGMTQQCFNCLAQQAPQFRTLCGFNLACWTQHAGAAVAHCQASGDC